MYPRGIEHVRPIDGSGQTVIVDNHFVVPSSGDTGTRVSIVVPGVILVQCTAGDSTEWDGAATANTTGSPGRLASGIVAKVLSPTGQSLPRNQIAIAESGVATIVPARGNVFRCLEDGDGGLIADADVYGYASLVIDTPYYTSDENTFTPNPEAQIKIDSSSISGGTSSNRMIKLMGPDPSQQYRPGEPRSFLFTFTDAFTVPVG